MGAERLQRAPAQRRALLLGSLGLLAARPGQAAGPLPLRIPDPVSFYLHGDYFLDLIRLGWRKGGTEGGEPPPLQPAAANLPRERLRFMLEQGELDLLWSTTTPERERRFLAVKVNLLRGLNDHRVLLVRRDDLPRLASLRSLEALRRQRAGLGAHWSDTQVFRRNGFAVTTAVQYESLFRMLAAGRFDFIPRSLVEADYDLGRFAALDLAVLPEVLLSYRQSFYFFVAPQRAALAQRLQRGLTLAQQDGSLAARFHAEPTLDAAWTRLQGVRGAKLTLKAD